ncbi:SDR family NAD(P)-dependent oxidoreductase [Streptomyces sp. SLBN-31]|uniref:SDR family NAD(P)-dependent oxidoreductase n=1 Tax=Streptomyces sp. SLBN-31 TaxID=2768444 RepID=UPI001154CAEA|nr:short subunit dehydrogenase [Streptomyces sp. SLBN-31]
MDLRGARILVPGAGGEIGAAFAVRLHALGVRTALAGRNREALTRVSAACEHVPARAFEAWDADSCAKTVDWAAAELGGLDGVVVCVGVAAFGPAGEVEDAVAGRGGRPVEAAGRARERSVRSRPPGAVRHAGAAACVGQAAGLTRRRACGVTNGGRGRAPWGE